MPLEVSNRNFVCYLDMMFFQIFLLFELFFWSSATVVSEQWIKVKGCEKSSFLRTIQRPSEPLCVVSRL